MIYKKQQEHVFLTGPSSVAPTIPTLHHWAMRDVLLLYLWPIATKSSMVVTSNFTIVREEDEKHDRNFNFHLKIRGCTLAKSARGNRKSFG